MSTSRPNPERNRGPKFAFLLAFVCAWALQSVLIVHGVSAQATIGLYTEPSGNTCSFSGNDPGLVTAYFVVRPVNGFTAVQFAAPIPDCLGATFVSEVVPPGMLSIGSSQTGISIALPNCMLYPTSVLQVTYLRSGTTTPCCEFAIVPDPSAGHLVASDCMYQEVDLVSTSSRFNADASCACIGNSPPFAPTSPAPYHTESNVSVFTSLGWSAADIDNNIAEYDLYLGTTPSPGLVASGLTEPTYTPPTHLDPFTQYYWRVIARDTYGLEGGSTTWTFTTRDVNSPPYAPLVVSPANGATGVLLDATLRWNAADVDDDPLVFDVYLGTSTTPPLLASDVTELRYTLSGLAFSTTYYWRIVARDPLGHETSGAVWSFVTRPENYPPNMPALLAPVNGAVGQLLNTVLSWTASDLDADTLVSDVYFGTTSPPPLVSSSQSATTYAPAGLVFSTQYYWRVVVRDHHGAETSGATWTFTTRPENYPPNVPSSPSPPNGSVNQSESSTLVWESGDLDGHAVTYDVYFGTSAPPPLVASNVTTKSFVPGLMAFGTTYRWQIVARDELGAETIGPLWVFTTRINSPPNLPTNPSPSNGSTNRPVNQTLAWACTDPNGHALTFDVYFGTTNPPPLAATNVATKSYAPGPLAFSTTYRWKIVARDAFGLEREGPAWSFTTKANTPPTTPSNPSPSNHGLSDDTPVLTWNAADVDLQPLTFDVYFGTTSPLPLVASGLTVAHYEPGTVAFGHYSWRVVVSDGLTSTNGPAWDFTVAPMGDANGNGTVELEDATCALGMFVGFGPCWGFTNPMADVNCSGTVTPRDARCIHKHIVDGSCAFCDGGVLLETASVNTPVVSVSSTWEWNDTLYVRLAVSGVPSLEAFGFLVQSNATYMRATRRGATTDFVELRNGGFAQFAQVGGYSLTGAPANSTVDFIDLRFYASYWTDRMLYILGFVDDLAGAAPLAIYGGGGSVPVLVTSFQAKLIEGGIELNWELKNDEAIESYTLYRREDGTALPVAIAQGAANARSYLDTSVEAGKTYHYELVIRTSGGDEFRSQIATASTQSLALTLGQNHPNPFNPQTVIPYDLPPSARSERVRLWILDISGRIVKTLVDENQGGGSYRVEWQGKDDRGESVSSGVYFYVLDVGGERRTRKLVLLK